MQTPVFIPAILRPRLSTRIRGFFKTAYSLAGYSCGWGHELIWRVSWTDVVSVSGFSGFLWTKGRFVRFHKSLDSCERGLNSNGEKSKYVKPYLTEICTFGSAYMNFGVWINAGPQPLFPAEPSIKNGWADPDSVSYFVLFQTSYPYFSWIYSIEFDHTAPVWTCLKTRAQFCWSPRASVLNKKNRCRN